MVFSRDPPLQSPTLRAGHHQSCRGRPTATDQRAGRVGGDVPPFGHQPDPVRAASLGPEGLAREPNVREQVDFLECLGNLVGAHPGPSSRRL